ncbi:MAG TPA: STAS/SEC14 domain-containing protein [Polyangium sp.]|nr:STAS/SEC14 domain-containing protein [Polyangium sp.]
MSADEYRPLGGHWVRVEGDLVRLRVKGVISVQDMAEFMRLQAAVRREQGWVFMLYDSRENTGLDPAARKYATEHTTSESRVDAAASFGAPFSMRVLVNMLNRARVVLGKPGTPVELFNTEAEARQYLESERRRLRPSVAA